MNHHSSHLMRELPRLGARQAAQLSEVGVRHRKDIEDVVRGQPDGGLMVSKFLNLDEGDFQKIMGWSQWPEQTGVTLSAPCPLGGVLPPAADMVNAGQSRPVAISLSALPAHASLISHYGPARSQGGIGTCTAFATIAVLEGQQSLPTDLSEAFEYSLTKALDGHGDSDGSWLRFATRVLIEYGSCREETWPYREDRDYLRQRPSNDAFEDAIARRIPSAPIKLEPNDVTAIRGEIAAGRPVAISVPIFRSSMYSLRFHSEGRFLKKLGVLDTVAGYHAMCAVAYVDDTYLTQHEFTEEPGGGAFVVRNSWGPTWARENSLAKHFGGEAGYALMPYAYLESYCFEAYTAAARTNSVPSRACRLPDRVRTAGVTWWHRTSDEVVTRARERLTQSLKVAGAVIQQRVQSAEPAAWDVAAR